MPHFIKHLSYGAIAAIFCAIIAVPPFAHAHKVVSAYYLTGLTIEGEVGFSNGDMAVDAPITIEDTNGNVLATLKTDADGMFVYQAPSAQDYIIRANLGAGHIATMSVAADAFDSISALSSPAVAPTQMATQPDTMPKTHDGLSDAQLAQMIGQVVEKHVRPLRKELAAYKEHNDLQKILGGIGYILGLFGVAFYIAARRNHKTSSRTP